MKRIRQRERLGEEIEAPAGPKYLSTCGLVVGCRACENHKNEGPREKSPALGFPA